MSITTEAGMQFKIIVNGETIIDHSNAIQLVIQESVLGFPLIRISFVDTFGYIDEFVKLTGEEEFIFEFEMAKGEDKASTISLKMDVLDLISSDLQDDVYIGEIFYMSLRHVNSDYLENKNLFSGYGGKTVVGALKEFVDEFLESEEFLTDVTSDVKIPIMNLGGLYPDHFLSYLMSLLPQDTVFFMDKENKIKFYTMNYFWGVDKKDFIEWEIFAKQEGTKLGIFEFNASYEGGIIVSTRGRGVVGYPYNWETGEIEVIEKLPTDLNIVGPSGDQKLPILVNSELGNNNINYLLGRIDDNFEKILYENMLATQLQGVMSVPVHLKINRGGNFLLTPGDKVEVLKPMFRPKSNITEEDVLDTESRFSGEWVIYSIDHVFMEDDFMNKITLVRPFVLTDSPIYIDN